MNELADELPQAAIIYIRIEIPILQCLACLSKFAVLARARKQDGTMLLSPISQMLFCPICGTEHEENKDTDTSSQEARY
jgi:hypothetical protein